MRKYLDFDTLTKEASLFGASLGLPSKTWTDRGAVVSGLQTMFGHPAQAPQPRGKDPEIPENIVSKMVTHYPDLLAEYDGKAAKGRAATVMMFFKTAISSNGATVYRFVVATSDDAAAFTRNPPRPTGGHQVVVWEFPDEKARQFMDLHSVVHE